MARYKFYMMMMMMMMNLVTHRS